MRQSLCRNPDLAPHSVFQRLDRDGNGHLTTIELLQFLRENQIYGATEANCYSILKYFDNNDDGKMQYTE